MRKLTTILLLFISFISFSQDFRTIDWKTNVQNVQLLSVDTFKFEADPIDFNDKGAISRDIGNYFIDFVARTFSIIDSDATTITVVDLASENTAPQSGQIGRVYQSIVDGDSLFQSIGGVDVSVIDELSRWKDVARNNELFGRAIASKQDTMPFDSVAFDTTYIPSGNEAGGVLTWNAQEYTVNIPTGLGPVLQVGQETYVVVFNNSGEQIDNLTAVRPINVTAAGYPTIGKVIADSHITISGVVYVTTMDIPDNSFGIVTPFGKARNSNTDSWDLGNTLYISATTAGELTNVKPAFPDYVIAVAAVTIKDAVNGEIFIDIIGTVEDTYINFWNGTFRESFDFRTVVTGGQIKGYTEPADGHPDMTMRFSDGLTMLPTTPADTIVLTASLDDTAPITNYVYVPQSTKVLTVNTSDWITAEHIRVAQIVVQTEATTALNGALRNQNINDPVEHTDNFQGHLSDITSAIREKIPATHKSGTEGSTTIITASTPDDVYFVVTGGVIKQMHNQNFPAFNMETGSDVHIVNHPTTPYLTTANFNNQLLDASGNGLNNTSFSVVVWGVANKTGEASHIMANLPTDSYAHAFPQNAVDDADNYSVYTIPDLFAGVGFLIMRVTFVYKNNVWSVFDIEDLRKKLPNTTAGGGGGGGGGATTYLLLDDTPPSFVADAFQKVNSAGTALENVLAENILLTGFDSTGFTLEQSQIVDLEDTITGLRSDIESNTVNYGDSYQIPANILNGGSFEYTDGFEFAFGALSVPDGSGNPKEGLIELSVVSMSERFITATPPADRGYYYFKTDSKPYAKNDLGINRSRPSIHSIPSLQHRCN